MSTSLRFLEKYQSRPISPREKRPLVDLFNIFYLELLGSLLGAEPNNIAFHRATAPIIDAIRSVFLKGFVKGLPLRRAICP